MPATMLLRNLDRVMDLTHSERQAVTQLPERLLHIGGRDDIVDGINQPTEVHVIRTGMACRYTILDSGERQITAVLVPGDCCDLRALIMGEIDHSIAALGACELAVMPHQRLFAAIEKHPRLALALWSDTLLDAAIHRRWVTNIGRRCAYARIAHLFCEIWFRLKSVGLARDHAFDLPMTQADLGDATGLSAVHVNRTIQKLRDDGLIQMMKGRVARLPDWQRLTEAAEFNPAYLRVANLRSVRQSTYALPGLHLQ